MKNLLLTVLAVLVCAAEAAERIIVKNGKESGSGYEPSHRPVGRRQM